MSTIPVSKMQVIRVIGFLKRFKLDGLSQSFFMDGGEVLKSELTMLLASIRTKEEIYCDWCELGIVLLYRKDERSL